MSDEKTQYVSYLTQTRFETEKGSALICIPWDAKGESKGGRVIGAYLAPGEDTKIIKALEDNKGAAAVEMIGGNLQLKAGRTKAPVTEAAVLADRLFPMATKANELIDSEKIKPASAARLTIALRDGVDGMKREFNEFIQPIEDTRERLRLWAQKHLLDNDAQNIKTDYGTILLTTKTSATLSDKHSFFEYVLAKKEYELLDIRVSKTGYQAYLDENREEEVPGVSFKQWKEASVQKPRKPKI